MMRELGRRSRLAAAVVGLGLLLGATGLPPPATGAPRAMLVVPFDATALGPDERWIGEGIAQILALGLAQHPGFVQIDRSRLRELGQPEVWGEAAVLQALRTVRGDVALYGTVARQGSDLVVHPRLLESKAGPRGGASPLPTITAPEDQLLERLAALPLVYVRSLGVAPTEAETRSIEKFSRPTRSPRAWELYSRSRIAAQQGGQEDKEVAIDLLARAIEADPSFVVAQYTLGVVHQSLGNRWKAAAQFRASTQLDAAYPEPYKALGDLYLAAPRRLYDQAAEAYGKAIELRPFYAEAWVGLGDARAAKSDVDGAIGAYQKALAFNPLNPRVHMSLGRIYYTEKGLYYEAVGAYQRAIELDPGSVEARMGLGEVYEDKGLYPEAIAEYRRVIELDGRHTGALYNLALVYEKVDPKEAIAQWERYIALASQVPSEKDWVDIARQHLRKLRNIVKE